MHSHIAVLIDGTSDKFSERLRKALEHHRLDEDDLASIRAHHWDYWYFPEEDPLEDPELRGKFSLESEDLLAHSAFVKNLPRTFSTSGLIREDGTWVDLQDFGWRMVDEPSPSNDEAKKTWERKLRAVLDNCQDDICVQVIVHG